VNVSVPRIGPPESGQRNDVVLAEEFEDLRRLRAEFVEGQDE
jgi:hypothetical protein